MNIQSSNSLKVAVLTFHFVQNYGAVLQAFALCKHLQDIGCHATVLDYPTFHRKKVFLSSRFLNIPIPSLVKLLTVRKQFRKSNRYKLFLESHLNLSERIKDIGRCASILEDKNAVVVGSDQVWNPKFGSDAMHAYFLTNIASSCIRMSYAACVGNSKISISTLQNYASHLNEFAGLSVRDEFSQAVLKNLNFESEIVVDPTLLIDWKSCQFEVANIDTRFSGRYIFVYGFSSDIDSVCSTLKLRLKIPVIAIGMEGEFSLNSADEIVHDAGPIEWFELIKNAEFVVTKSFHGVMLSVSLEKQFIVVLDSGLSRERILDFCHRFGATDCLLEPGKKLDEELDLSHIVHYESIGPVLEKAIRASKNFIRRCLLIE